MGRKKATMNLIGSRSVRYTTLKRRRASILKKASELTKLCGKPVCLVVSDGPDNSSPVVWPSQEEAAQMLSMAKSMPEGKQKKKKLVREVAEIQEQVQNQDRENLHLEAMLQMQLKEALGRIDSQLTITPLSVAPDTNSLETRPFDPFGLASISMPTLLDTPNVKSGEGGIIQTKSLNCGAAYACPSGGEEKEIMQWDGEHLEPILEEECLLENEGPLTPILEKYKLMDYLMLYETSLDLDTAGHEASSSERCSTSCM